MFWVSGPSVRGINAYAWRMLCGLFVGRYLMKFLARLAESSEQNKMTAANLAIVIAPSLLWPPPATDIIDSLLTGSGSVLSADLIVGAH